MSAATHTPGPWWPLQNSAGAWMVATYRDSDEQANDKRIGSTSGAIICTSIGDYTEARTSGNEKANARLIAAAPDLLQALIDIEKYVNDSRLGETHEAQQARAAIAKATGGAA